jgi:hypothetical protein
MRTRVTTQRVARPRGRADPMAPHRLRQCVAQVLAHHDQGSPEWTRDAANPDCGGGTRTWRRRISLPCPSLPSVNAIESTEYAKPAKVREKEGKTLVRGLLAGGESFNNARIMLLAGVIVERRDRRVGWDVPARGGELCTSRGSS